MQAWKESLFSLKKPVILYARRPFLFPVIKPSLFQAHKVLDQVVFKPVQSFPCAVKHQSRKQVFRK